MTRTHRFFEKTIDDVLRGTIDFTGNAFFAVRTIYEHSKRTGTGFDEEVLDDIGEQVSLRQFDISNRDRDRVSAVIQVTPIEQLGITASIAYRPNPADLYLVNSGIPAVMQQERASASP